MISWDPERRPSDEEVMERSLILDFILFAPSQDWRDNPFPFSSQNMRILAYNFLRYQGKCNIQNKNMHPKYWDALA